MKSHNQNCLVDSLLREYVNSKRSWPLTDAEIDALLNDDAQADPYTKEERSARVKAVLDACGERLVPAESEQLVLFEAASLAPAATSDQSADLFEVVRRAYREVHEGWSSDRLIADPDMDARFIQACWRLGVKASQFELNHLLMNARKRKIIGKTEGARKYHVDPKVMDQYSLASEFAARIIQDREFLKHQRRITVDHILCDPRLASEFDEVAKVVSPGHTSLDYRWAALAIRKARSRSQGHDIGAGAFQRRGPLDGVRPGQIAPVEGFVWVRAGGEHIYIGHGQNLRAQVKRILEIRIERVMSEFPLFQAILGEPLELWIAERPRSQGLSRQPNRLVRGFRPCLNVLTGSLLKTLGKGTANGETERTCGAA